jgi:hypothetical protein
VTFQAFRPETGSNLLDACLTSSVLFRYTRWRRRTAWMRACSAVSPAYGRGADGVVIVTVVVVL